MNTTSFVAAMRRLPATDRALLIVLVACALVSLALGTIFGASTGLVRAGLLDPDPERGYRLMTAHGVTIFFYWLYFAQAALLLAFAAAYGRPAQRLALSPAAWLGLVLMLAGLAASQLGIWLGAPLLYDGSPELVGDDDRVVAGVFYVGYLLLGGGLVLLAAAAIGTAVAGKAEDGGRAWSAITFGTVTWAGLVMVSAVATLNVFLPAALWAFGLGGRPADHTAGWHVLFHNLHYLPLLGTVLAWYVLIRDMTGVGSILGERFSKAVFTVYLVVVPPTSLYHMFLEPGLVPLVLALGSLLSLFIGVPTIAMFLVIVASLEAHARAQGARGLFGWLRVLPWREPAMPPLGMAVVNLALGGTLAFVLIQEQLAGLLSDTFFVPGYFHFLTVGTVTLTLLAALARLVPGLSGRALRTPRLLLALPYVITAGLLLFGAAGVAAGLTGMPRRVLDVSLDGAAPAAWLTLSRIIGTGGLIMAAGLLLYVGALGGTLVVGRRPAESAITAPPALIAPGPAALREAAVTGPLSVLVLVVAMYAMTVVAFELSRALPLLVSGNGGH
jgi:cytochrome c oxidase subunit I